MLLSILIGCEEDSFQPEQIIYSIEHALLFQNSQIDTVYDRGELTLAASHSGNQLVFSYFFSQEHKANVADDEYEQELFFEISPFDTIFEFTENLYNETKLQFKDRCFGNCTGEFIAIHDGKLTGEKIDSTTWFVILHLDNESLGRMNKIRFIENFKLQN